MLLNSVIIVLREVLEAALMISVLLVVSRTREIHLRWVLTALIGGVVGSITLGLNMQSISELFDGVGQEVIDALIQYLVFVALAGCVFEIVRHRHSYSAQGTALPRLMIVSVVLAMTREGAEIMIYISGFWQLDNFLYGVGLGSLLGACIGLSVGVLFYHALQTRSAERLLWLSVLLLSLIGAGMCSQATQLMIQADWIPASAPLWDTSALLPEDSLPGQLLYALVGYEASPSVSEVAIYGASLVIMAGASFLGARCASGRETYA